MTSFFATIFSSPTRIKEPARPSSTPRRKHLQPSASPLKSHLIPQTVSKAPSTRKSVTFKVPILEETPPRLQFQSQLPPHFDTPLEADENKENTILQPSPLLSVNPLDTVHGSSPCPSPDPRPKTSRKTRSPQTKDSSNNGKSSSAVDNGEESVEESFERFIGYRWSESDLELHVEWTSGVVSWEPESSLYSDAPAAVLEYYEEIGGRPKNPADPLLYDVHGILKHSPDRKKVLVEWVGFGPKEATWEPRHVIAKAAPQISKDYWAEQASKKTRGKAKARGRRRQ